jgi:chromosomal replication initiation ATPase DnaA
MLDRDHSTVMHGCRRIATLRLEDAKLDAEISELIGLLAQVQQHD